MQPITGRGHHIVNVLIVFVGTCRVLVEWKDFKSSSGIYSKIGQKDTYLLTTLGSDLDSFVEISNAFHRKIVWYIEVDYTPRGDSD